MTEAEARLQFGDATILEVEAEGVANISISGAVAGSSLKTRRLALGLGQALVARRAGLHLSELNAIEDARHRSIRDYERVAQVLGLPISVLYDGNLSSSDATLGTRLRTLGSSEGKLTESSVALLSEISWVCSTEQRLEKQIHEVKRINPTPVPLTYPAYQQGYDLARQFRQEYGLGTRPIESLRHLAEEILGVSIVHGNLQADVAGATLNVGGNRVIVLNGSGPNGRVEVRRATIAHELCHLLYDHDTDLKSLRVDRLDNEERIKENDQVEQRANAFAAELLAPRTVLKDEQGSVTIEGLTNYFGVSVTLLRYQAFNAFGRIGSPFDINFDALRAQDWDGSESYTTGYSPIVGLLDRPIRAGRFAAVVIRAVELDLISADSAAEWLKSPVEDVLEKRVRNAYAGLYEDLWEDALPAR